MCIRLCTSNACTMKVVGMYCVMSEKFDKSSVKTCKINYLSLLLL